MENPENKKRLFVDIDGTLAEFKTINTIETLYEKGYFESLKPNKNVVEAIKDIVKNHSEIDVYIISAVLSDSKYALSEKKNWLEKYLPEIPREKCIFPPCGSDKKNFIPDGIRPDDYLLDDYSINLNSWEPPARGIKLLNGINGNNGTWKSDSLSCLNSGAELSDKLCKIINGGEKIVEQRPQKLAERDKFSEEINRIIRWTEKAEETLNERNHECEPHSEGR